ncbi:hypothetical protein U1Q18_045385 [Sarracenia purpurea var. burkii]
MDACDRTTESKYLTTTSLHFPVKEISLGVQILNLNIPRIHASLKEVKSRLHLCGEHIEMMREKSRGCPRRGAVTRVGSALARRGSEVSWSLIIIRHVKRAETMKVEVNAKEEQ